MAITSVHCRLPEELLKQPLQKIAECGACERRTYASGAEALLLPPRTLPAECCDPATWTADSGNGRTRLARKATSSASPASEFWVKSPEYRLTLSKEELGDVWWDGERGPDRYNFFYVREEILRAFARWEAAYLVKLWHTGIPAEEPQALIDYPDGRTDVVIRGIKAPTWHRSLTREQNWLVKDTHKELRRQVTEIGLLPNDFQWLIDMEELRFKIIDTARWSWPPHTDALFTEVRRLLQEALRISSSS